MLNILTGIFVMILMFIVTATIGWLIIDMLLPNLFRGIRKFTIRGCIDFIKAVYNMETK